MPTMRMSVEPPDGYSFAVVLGREKYHLVKIEPFNNVAVCGKRIYPNSLTDSAVPDRIVCKDCWQNVFLKNHSKKAVTKSEELGLSCPACKNPYGYDVRGVCVKCEKCYGCCRCKIDGRVTVDAITFLEEKAAKKAPQPEVQAPSYSEHDKLRLVKDKTQFTMTFLRDFCESKGLSLTDRDDNGVNVEELLYEFIDVDRWKLEEEKRLMLAGVGKPDGRPHGVSCECCRAESVCHVCGEKVTKENRCVSGACPGCCRDCHIHKSTR